MSIESGGYAYPQSETVGSISHSTGMTLRDYFAGQALAGYLSDPNVGGDPTETARRMYAYADAMIKARDKESAK